MVTYGRSQHSPAVLAAVQSSRAASRPSSKADVALRSQFLGQAAPGDLEQSSFCSHQLAEMRGEKQGRGGGGAVA